MMGDVIANQKMEGLGDRVGAGPDESSQNCAIETMDNKTTEEIVDEEKIVKGDSSKRMTEEVIDDEVADTAKDEEDKERLHKMGLNTAIAIGLHNFPEGKHIQRS